MSNVDSLLDLGEGTTPPPVSETAPATGSDPFDMFDPFSASTDGQVTNNNTGSAFDDFDPFATPASAPTMTTATLSEKDQAAFESQFDDLMGDFSNGPQQNGEMTTTSVTKTVDGDEVTTVTTKTHDNLQGKDGTEEPERTEAGGTKDDNKKALDYVKGRYEGGEAKQDLSKAKIIREPKKLEHQYEKRVEESQKPGAEAPKKKKVPTATLR